MQITIDPQNAQDAGQRFARGVASSELPAHLAEAIRQGIGPTRTAVTLSLLALAGAIYLSSRRR